MMKLTMARTTDNNNKRKLRYKKLILMEYGGLTIQPKSKETITRYCQHTFSMITKDSLQTKVNLK